MYNRKKIEEMTKTMDLSVNGFIENAKRYIKAIEQGRVIVNIESVSLSGMSRTMKFLECAKYKDRNEFTYLNFFVFFKALGYSFKKDSDVFRVHGCGMDMVFNTNYNNIHNLYNLGFMSKEKCSRLSQMTPSVI